MRTICCHGYFTLLFACVVLSTTPALAQLAPPHTQLVHANELSMSGPVDSNSPSVWSSDGSELHLFTSFAGSVQTATGPNLSSFGEPSPISWVRGPVGGTWMEAVVRDDQDVLYGYYHNEVPATDCTNDGKVRPQIGAARSTDDAATWEDLGVIVTSSEPSKCDTTNRYNDGGVGDFSVMLDPDRNYLYVFFSAYGPSLDGQGVSVARMAWADRDQPLGALAVWQGGLWLPASPVVVGDDEDAAVSWVYPTGSPIYQVTRSWHSDDGIADAFWGPSVHWNTYLQQYVMLLNRADSVSFNQEGIYIAFADSLDDPTGWSQPARLLAGGTWYPQVLGIEQSTGSDKQAGQEARFFVSGHSTAMIVFNRTDHPVRAGSRAATAP
jgi:hypothetical protein